MCDYILFENVGSCLKMVCELEIQTQQFQLKIFKGINARKMFENVL